MSNLDAKYEPIATRNKTHRIYTVVTATWYGSLVDVSVLRLIVGGYLLMVLSYLKFESPNMKYVFSGHVKFQIKISVSAYFLCFCNKMCLIN